MGADTSCVTAGNCKHVSLYFTRLVGRRCNGCKRIVNGEDWVRKVSAHTVYHLACFSCVVCKRQLSTGEEYSLSVNCSVHCTQHHYCGNSAASVGTGGCGFSALHTLVILYTTLVILYTTLVILYTTLDRLWSQCNIDCGSNTT